MQNTIIVVEDDVRLAKLMKDYLSEQGFTVTTEDRGDRAIYRINKLQPDVVVLDVMLPKVDGLTICKEIRQYYNGLILMLTASAGSQTEIESLDLGADDYLKKPVDPEVLLAHIKALLRRKMDAHTPLILEFGALKIDSSTQNVYWQNQYVDLSRKEFEILCFLAHHAGKPVNRDSIMQALRGFDYDASNRSIDMTISSLRKKLHDTGERIQTVWGKGYLFVAEGW